MSVEVWKLVFDWATVVLAALTFVALAGALITGNILNERQESQLRQFDKDLTDAKADLVKQEQRAATMETEALALQKQLLAQGSRSALLYGDNRARFVEKLKSFKGQRIDVRHCRTSFNQFFIDQDAMSLSMLLAYVLSNEAKWAVNHPIEENCSGTGVSISLSPRASESSAKAANALLNALTELPLAVVGPSVLRSDAQRSPQLEMYNAAGERITLPKLDADTIVLTVLAHP